VAESMPKARLKSLKPSTSSTMNPNTIWSSSLESYTKKVILCGTHCFEIQD
jgi:hypothetical protein